MAKPKGGMNERYYQAVAKALAEDRKTHAWDFPYEGVRIVHDDGSILNLRFAVVRPQPDGFLFVFSEHVGVIVLHQDDLKSVEVRETEANRKKRLKATKKYAKRERVLLTTPYPTAGEVAKTLGLSKRQTTEAIRLADEAMKAKKRKK